MVTWTEGLNRKPMSMPSKRPERSQLPFTTLFGDGDQNRTLALIADGLATVLNHVAALITDVEVLVGASRYARARFLIATADEELGKCHLLLDCARLGGPEARKRPQGAVEVLL